MLGDGQGALPSHMVPLPSPPPVRQPEVTTCDMNCRAGMQKEGTVKPPDGMRTSWRQPESPGPISILVWTPVGKGNGAKPPTLSEPGVLVRTISSGAQPGAAAQGTVVDVELVVDVVELVLVLVVVGHAPLRGRHLSTILSGSRLLSVPTPTAEIFFEPAALPLRLSATATSV